jgi:hypothetical protein
MMRLILGQINGEYLRSVTDNHAEDTEEVLAAVAYATDSAVLFDWCWENQIPLRFYGRLDDRLAVSIPILSKFLGRKSGNFVCRLVQHHHAKVIWWRGVGAYIGSANLTGKAWYSNVEAGCFLAESEMTDEIAGDLLSLFSMLDSHATPLTEELFEEMQRRARALEGTTVDASDFWASPSIKTWSGLAQVGRVGAQERRKQAFLEEWHATLQDLRDIGVAVSRSENRPAWVSRTAPNGAQADQFLHAHYYQRTFEGRKAMYQEFFHANKNHRQRALDEAIAWWKSLPKAPENEDEMLNVTAPRLRDLLSQSRVGVLSYEEFFDVCMSVHAIRDYARRVPNKAVGLSDTGDTYTIRQKVAALSKRIWNDQSSDGKRIRAVLTHLLYGGSNAQLPERLWECVTDDKRKISGLGISALGELVGWALPNEFPPRNGRTSKALRSLGYEVNIHVQ